jgi:hypothetical protein
MYNLNLADMYTLKRKIAVVHMYEVVHMYNLNLAVHVAGT